MAYDPKSTASWPVNSRTSSGETYSIGAMKIRFVGVSAALSFLEAQTWHQGILAWTEESSPIDSTPRTTNLAAQITLTEQARPGLRADSARWRATVAIAFFAGLFVRDPMFHWPLLPDGRANPEPVADVRQDDPATAADTAPGITPAVLEPSFVTISVRTNLNPNVPGKLQIPVTAPDKHALTATGKREMPDYVRKQWEKRGYQVAQLSVTSTPNCPMGAMWLSRWMAWK